MDDDASCVAAGNAGPHEAEIAKSEGIVTGLFEHGGVLLGRHGLACQSRLVDEQIVCGEQPEIRWNKVASRQPHDVAGNHLIKRDLREAFGVRTMLASFAAAVFERCSCTKLRLTLRTTITEMTTADRTSESSQDTTAKPRRRPLSGFLTLPQSSNRSGGVWLLVTRLAPIVASRSSACDCERPLDADFSSEYTAAVVALHRATSWGDVSANFDRTAWCVGVSGSGNRGVPDVVKV
jgi:hypothetical protein